MLSSVLNVTKKSRRQMLRRLSSLSELTGSVSFRPLVLASAELTSRNSTPGVDRVTHGQSGYIGSLDECDDGNFQKLFYFVKLHNRSTLVPTNVSFF